MRHLFDPDVHVQNFQPHELRFPLWVFVDRSLLLEEVRCLLPDAPHHGARALLLLTTYNDEHAPTLVRVGDLPDNLELWIPWAACSPDLTLLPN